MENKSIITATTKVNQDGEIIRQDKVEFETFNEAGAIFFQKCKRGFVISIREFSSELTASDIEKFTMLFFGEYVAAGTNRLELPGTRRKFKEMDRAEVAEALGFEGKTAVTKCTTLLNKFIRLGVMAKKMNGKVEEWYANPLLIKTSHRLSVDLFELFQPSLEEAMQQQKAILGFLKAAIKEKYVSQVNTMSKATARKEIEKEQYMEKLVEEARNVPTFKTDITHATLIERLIAEFAQELPGMTFSPARGLSLEETRNILISIYAIVDKYNGERRKGQWVATEDDMAELTAATNGAIVFMEKASAPTEARKVS